MARVGGIVSVLRIAWNIKHSVGANISPSLQGIERQTAKLRASLDQRAPPKLSVFHHARHRIDGGVIIFDMLTFQAIPNRSENLVSPSAIDSQPSAQTVTLGAVNTARGKSVIFTVRARAADRVVPLARRSTKRGELPFFANSPLG